MRPITATAPTISSCLLVSLTLTTVAAQDLYSEHPSRSAILAGWNSAPAVAEGSNHTRRNEQLNILGYVTPWNPEGYDLVENYRGRFDSVSPVWYTLKPTLDDVTKYAIAGGPNWQEVAWARRLSQPSNNEITGQELPPVKVLPRVLLEGWSKQQFSQLLSSFLEGMALTEAIVAEIVTRNFDGVVLETGAIWALYEPVKMLAERLHNEGKDLVIVLPAIRDADPESNQLITSVAKRLAPIVDGMHVMTYDHLGPMGAPAKFERPIPEDSPLLRDGVRTPGPNAPHSFIRENIIALSGASDEHEKNEEDQGFATMENREGSSFDPRDATNFQPEYEAANTTSISPATILDKLLVGISMYGYEYPIAFMNDAGIPQLTTPPPSPIMSKDNSTAEQAKYRAKADKRDSTRPVTPILGNAGKAITIRYLIDVLKNNKALVRKDAASGENYIEYVKAKEDGSTHKTADGSEAPVAWYRRAFFPSPNTIRERLDTVEETRAGGIALWDVGQGGAWLLHQL
ncbi:unnamed protein product [Sympodiomycopsis kandeliae]